MSVLLPSIQWYCNTLLGKLHTFFVTDVSAILLSAGKALQGSYLPKSIEATSYFTTEKWIKLMPTVACVLFFSSLPFIFFYKSQQHPKNKKRETFWLTRYLMIKMIGLIFFSAFITLAFQIRPLYGENGIYDPSYDDFRKNDLDLIHVLLTFVLFVVRQRTMRYHN